VRKHFHVICLPIARPGKDIKYFRKTDNTLGVLNAKVEANIWFLQLFDCLTLPETGLLRKNIREDALTLAKSLSGCCFV